MTKEEFRGLFKDALEAAARNAEEQLGHTVPRSFRILLHGAGHPGDLMDPAAAVDALYLGEELFYRIIDLAVVKVGKHFTTVFVRASGHRPGPFEQTWNTPPGTGPFKQLIAEKIKIVQD
jgi:hypothetical protein